MKQLKNRRVMAGTALALALSLGVAACGDDDDSTSSDDTTVTENSTDNGTEDAPAGEDGPANGETAEDDGPVLEVLAVDYAFEDLPDSIEAGTRLHLRNEAPGELHELVAFRLADDETRTIDEIVALPPEEMQALLGEPVTVLLAPPMSEQIATPVGDGTLNEPGRYALLCVIPTGADPDEYLAAAAGSDGPPDVAGGPPHIAHGMYAEIEVV